MRYRWVWVWAAALAVGAFAVAFCHEQVGQLELIFGPAWITPVSAEEVAAEAARKVSLTHWHRAWQVSVALTGACLVGLLFSAIRPWIPLRKAEKGSTVQPRQY